MPLSCLILNQNEHATGFGKVANTGWNHLNEGNETVLLAAQTRV
jgi:hypothetical protein